MSSLENNSGMGATVPPCRAKSHNIRPFSPSCSFPMIYAVKINFMDPARCAADVTSGTRQFDKQMTTPWLPNKINSRFQRDSGVVSCIYNSGGPHSATILSRRIIWRSSSGKNCYLKEDPGRWFRSWYLRRNKRRNYPQCHQHFHHRSWANRTVKFFWWRLFYALMNWPSRPGCISGWMSLVMSCVLSRRWSVNVSLCADPAVPVANDFSHFSLPKHCHPGTAHPRPPCVSAFLHTTDDHRGSLDAETL